MSYTFDQVVEAATKYFNGNKSCAEIWARKYALKSSPSAYEELTPDDMHRRLAREFARIEAKFKKSALSEDVIFEHLARFSRVVPQGSPMAAIGNDFNVMSASNCTVVTSPKDSLTSIMHTGSEIAQLMKRRCGVGVDLSNLRPYNSPVHNAAQSSSGSHSFADFFSYISRMVGQKGRQGALMLSLDVLHPDSPLFTTIKHNPLKVTGANISLRLNNEFMKAIEEKKDITLRWPLHGKPKYTRSVNASELFDIIVDSAYKTGDPGLLMWDNITANLPAHCYPEFQTISTNPCAELPLSAGDSCRLISINLANFVTDPFTDTAKFDSEAFDSTVRVATRLSDDLVELELEQILKIRNSCTNKLEKTLWHNMYEAARLGRRAGQGTHGLGDMFTKLRIRYDSDEAHQMAQTVYSMLRDVTYRTSVELAKERGAFPLWDWKKESKCEFFRRMPTWLIADMKKHGRRNISLLTNAPTGTVSLLSQTTSGIEPIFRLEYLRRVKIQGNEGVTIDHVDELGDKWHNYTVLHPGFIDYCRVSKTKLNPNKPLKEQSIEAPDFFASSERLDYRRNIKLIGIIQSFIDHGVSCTVNMPRESTPEMVKQVYVDAWKAGMKGVTVYVDGAKAGVLVTDNSESIVSSHAPKRPRDVPCEIHLTTNTGKRWLVIVGLVKGQPYEVFAGRACDLPMSRDVTKAVIRKIGKRQFCLVYEEEGEEIFVPIKESFLEPNGMLVRLLLNQSLRHGIPLSVIYDTVSKASDINDFSRTVIRVLKKYIPEGSTWGLKCKACGSENVRLVDGCAQCQSCMYSKCG